MFTSTGAYGGMAGYQLNGQGDLTLVDTQAYAPRAGASLSTEITLLNHGGTPHMMVGGHGAGHLTQYDITVDGQISGAQTLGGVPSAQGAQAASAATGEFVFLANPWGEGVAVYDQNGATLSLRDSVTDTHSSYGYGVTDMVTVTVGGQTYLITAAQGQTTSGWSPSEAGITSYQVSVSGNITRRDSLGAEAGQGLLVPTDRLN